MTHPVHVQASSASLVTLYDVQTGARIIITIDGDARSLLPHVSRILEQAVDSLDEESEE